MNIPEQHKYAAAALTGMSLLGETTLLYKANPVTVFYLTLIGGITGIYTYHYTRQKNFNEAKN